MALARSGNGMDEPGQIISGADIHTQLANALYKKEISWLAVMERLYTYYIQEENYALARRTVEALILEYPNEEAYYDKAAMLSGQLKDGQRALLFFKRSFALSPSFEKSRYIFVLLLQRQQHEAALPYLNYAIEHNTTRFNLRAVKDSVVRLMQANSSKNFKK